MPERHFAITTMKNLVLTAFLLLFSVAGMFAHRGGEANGGKSITAYDQLNRDGHISRRRKTLLAESQPASREWPDSRKTFKTDQYTTVR